jgi:hypothetical protein
VCKWGKVVKQKIIMTNQLKWRLGKLPTSDEVLKLVNDKIISKEEAREILFNEEVQTERDKKSLEDEIKFLKEIIEKLSNNNTTKIVEIIKEVKVPYYQWNWYKPYEVWCGGALTSGTLAGSGTVYLGTSNTTDLTNAVNCSFSNIQTF